MPKTSTACPSGPAAFTALSSASRTAWPPFDRQPAAPQTATRQRFSARAARSLSCSSRRASVLMAVHRFERALLGPRLLRPRRDARERRLDADLAGHLAVEDDRRREAAGAEAARRHQRDAAVGRRLAGLDLVLLLERLQDLAGALHVAGGAHAHDAGVLALGLEGEEVVEGRDAVDARERHAQRAADVHEHVGVEVAEQLLRRVQHLDQRVRPELVALDRDVEELEALVAAGVGGVCGVRFMSSPAGLVSFARTGERCTSSATTCCTA